MLGILELIAVALWDFVSMSIMVDSICSHAHERMHRERERGGGGDRERGAEYPSKQVLLIHSSRVIHQCSVKAVHRSLAFMGMYQLCKKCCWSVYNGEGR